MIGLVPGIVSSVALNVGAKVASSIGSAQNAASPGADGVSFAQFLEQLSSETVQNLKAGEAAAISGVQGKASVQQVVDAIMTAERSLHTAIAVRDKIVGAYQEISRMAI
jgi:flagellar hook-basal body complex protein FliE